MIKFLTNIFKALNSNSHPGEIAHAICCGMLLGYKTKNNALWYILFFAFQTKKILLPFANKIYQYS